MAQPVEFGQVNYQWHGEGDTGTLPVYRDLQTGGNVSCWELSAEEQIEVLQTGKVWLTVWGTHPPVALQGSDPFVPEKADD